MSDTDKTTPVPVDAAAKPARRRSRKRILMLVVPLVLIVAGGWFWLSAGRYVATDNAYVKQDVVAVVTEVAGRITDVAVGENDHVEAGDLLFRIDPARYRIAVQQADAAVANARLEVEQMRATYRSAVAEEKAAGENLDYAQSVFDRYRELLSSGTTARAQYDEAENDLQTARQRLAQAQQSVAKARAALMDDPDIETDRHPLVMQALADRADAELDLDHAEIRAPAAGLIAQTDRLQQGQYVADGTAVLSLVETGDSWVEANFKETDLAHMAPGQAVALEIDAYPGAAIEGEVASIGAGTGAEFSLLPAQNATGNWVKVVQRVPVRIRFAAPGDMPLRTGLSASVEVDTHHHRPLFNALASFFGEPVATSAYASQ